MLRYVKNGMLLLSVAYIVIGMLLLIMPETSLLWICNIFGVVVLVTGMRASAAQASPRRSCWWAASSRRGWASSRWQSRR